VIKVTSASKVHTERAEICASFISGDQGAETKLAVFQQLTMPSTLVT